MGEPAPDRHLAELLAICADVFGRDVAAGENFFDLGGDSAQATDLFLRLEARLGVELDVTVFFEAADFRDLASRLAGSTTPAVDGSGPGTPA
ncbi:MULTISPECIES: acyl carrier protein [Polymorphospora]|uniref:Acyl carrier protein n=1 Tax=Polymorphospora lycopeni TaxID=3140240 RepID=A0ABV5CUM1_9ACTN